MNRPTATGVHQGGFILPIALLAMLLVAFAARSLLSQSSHLASLLAIQREGARLHDTARSAITTAQIAQRECGTVNASHHNISNSWLACMEGAGSLTSFPKTPLPAGRFDYNQIFSAASPCPTTPLAVTKSSFDSPTASHDCTPPALLQGDLIVRENLKAQNISLASSNQERVRLLATPGSLLIESALELNGDLLIVAGGTVTIGQIVNLSPKLIHVTVVSALGTIEVLATQGEISLLIIGSKTLKAPTTLIVPPFPLPALRLAAVLGLLPLNRSGS